MQRRSGDRSQCGEGVGRVNAQGVGAGVAVGDAAADGDADALGDVSGARLGSGALTPPPPCGLAPGAGMTKIFSPGNT